MTSLELRADPDDARILGRCVTVTREMLRQAMLRGCRNFDALRRGTRCGSATRGRFVAPTRSRRRAAASGLIRHDLSVLERR